MRANKPSPTHNNNKKRGKNNDVQQLHKRGN